MTGTAEGAATPSPREWSQYTVKLRQDDRERSFTLGSPSASAAVWAVLTAESVDIRSVLHVHRRPTCNHCVRPADLYELNGAEDPICKACARDHFDNWEGIRDNTRPLGVTRLELVSPVEWCTTDQPGWDAVGRDNPVYTRHSISQAVNDAVELVKEELGLHSERDDNLLNLVVNSSLHRLDNPDASLDEVITANYDHTPEQVRGWCFNRE
jgi:hypothetical protein